MAWSRIFWPARHAKKWPKSTWQPILFSKKSSKNLPLHCGAFGWEPWDILAALHMFGLSRHAWSKSWPPALPIITMSTSAALPPSIKYISWTSTSHKEPSCHLSIPGQAAQTRRSWLRHRHAVIHALTWPTSPQHLAPEGWPAPPGWFASAKRCARMLAQTLNHISLVQVYVEWDELEVGIIINNTTKWVSSGSKPFLGPDVLRQLVPTSCATWAELWMSDLRKACNQVELI